MERNWHLDNKLWVMMVYCGNFPCAFQPEKTLEKILRKPSAQRNKVTYLPRVTLLEFGTRNRRATPKSGLYPYGGHDKIEVHKRLIFVLKKEFRATDPLLLFFKTFTAGTLGMMSFG